MDAHYEKAYFAEIVALLRAANAHSSVSFNGMQYGVQIELEDGRKAVWGNYENWACSLVERDGSITTHNSHLAADAPVDAVAKVILHTDYDQEPVDA